jgi:hypothetical protein
MGEAILTPQQSLASSMAAMRIGRALATQMGISELRLFGGGIVVLICIPLRSHVYMQVHSISFEAETDACA